MSKGNFSTLSERHQKIAKTFYENIEYEHPDAISSNGQGHRWVHHCKWSSTCVKYYKYNGPDVKHI